MKEITQAGNQLWHQVHERFTEQIRWRFNKQAWRQVVISIYGPILQTLKG